MDKPLTYWDTFQDRYQMGMQSHREYLLDLLTDKGVESILDVGCGTGPIYELIVKTQVLPHAANFVKRWNFGYKGTDYSPAMIEVCKKEFPEGNFEVQDARSLNEAALSWDCVLLMHCLDHLDDYQSAIKEAARVAKKYVLIVLWRGINYSEGGQNNLNDRNMYGKQEGDEPWQDTHLQDYAWEPLKKAFDDAGLTVTLKVDGEEVNKEGKYNTVILLEK